MGFKNKIKHAFHRLVGIVIVGWFISLLLPLFLPYVAAIVALYLPFWGVIRDKNQKNLSQYGIKNWPKFLWDRIGKKFSFYLLLGVIIGFLDGEIAELIFRTCILCAASMVVSALVWETARAVATFKGYKVMSFMEAIKKSL